MVLTTILLARQPLNGKLLMQTTVYNAIIVGYTTNVIIQASFVLQDRYARSGLLLIFHNLVNVGAFR